jgi:hypothetical protein
VKTVNSAFSHFHSDLMRMKDNKKSDAKDVVENADKLLKELRQNAVKAIHATKSCAGAKDDDDEDDQDEDEDNDERKSSKREGNFIVVLFTNLQSFFGTRTVTVDTNTASTSMTSFTAPTDGTSSGTTSDDPQTIADNAVAAMQLVFDEAKAQLDDLPTPSPRAVNTPKPKGTAKADDHRGKNEHGPHNDADDDEDDD